MRVNWFSSFKFIFSGCTEKLNLTLLKLIVMLVFIFMCCLVIKGVN